ncbi:hypothetical protein LSH36_32g08050 [Paralvinella palmiformis]|uniref:Uncharacterized protein n=1 Tax=Paralvinella palmiformis TaxID=53620 RepID=A0AAD9NH78_9ANNE|nr:hypothetical protein LSH36_32g08050 [Paralvinella palmiformis]
MSKLEECDSLMKIPSLLSLEMAEVEGNKHETDVIKESDEFHTNHNSTPSSYEVNSQLNEDETEPEMNNCSRITPGSTRSRESIFITEAFSFLPQEDANENEVDSKSEVTVSSGESELDSLATGAEDGDLANGGKKMMLKQPLMVQY